MDILLPVCEHCELLLGWRLVFDGQQWMRNIRLLLWSNTDTRTVATRTGTTVLAVLRGSAGADGMQWLPCVRIHVQRQHWVVRCHGHGV